MKIMKRMMGCAAAILALSACSESEDLLSAFHSDPNAVRITAQVGKASANGFTRSNPLGATEADQKKFNENDEISVQADGQDAVTYKLVGSEWQPQGGKFLKWESNEMNFTAYYPASFDGNLDKVTLPKEYDAASLAANDFMSYSGKQSNTKGNQLSLIMERKMARVVVEIDGFNDQYAGATVNSINSLSICGVKAYKHNDKKFYALIKPCEAQNSATFISLDVAEGASKTTTETLAGIPELTAGKSYTYQLTVGKDKVSVSGITVKDWQTGNITGGSTDVKDKTPYVTFSAPAEQTFKMVCYGGYKISNLQYSVNFGDWKEVKANEGVTFGGQKGGLRLRGKNVKGTADPNDTRIYSTITFAFDKDKENNVNTNVMVACTGDIRTLLDYDHYETVSTSEARFVKLFNNCQALTSAPKLPATDIASDCYNSMFNWCRYLKNAPELPATVLKDQCYQNMFNACVSLTSAPKLPATKLAFNCYANMFSYCYWLKEAPELPATTLAWQCYQDMFAYCYFTKAPKLPAEIMKTNCYAGMFAGCTNLTEAPELPAKQIESFCYSRMFQGCTKLSTVTMLAPSDQISKASNCCYNWLDNAGTSATSRKLKLLDKNAYDATKAQLPTEWQIGNCTVLDNAGNEIK
uniref:fimbrillin family protein n=1 Tax=Prevotella sp. TaxID=59823 RepID=UPI003FF0E4EE